MNADSSFLTSKNWGEPPPNRFKVDFSSRFLFWSDAASSSSDQALRDWTLIGWSWSCSTRRPRGTTGTQTRPKTGLCKQPPCGGDAHGAAAVSPKWASKKAALVPAWKYIAVIQDANHVFSMCVCEGVFGQRVILVCWAITGQLLTVTSDQNTGYALLDSPHCYSRPAVELKDPDRSLSDGEQTERSEHGCCQVIYHKRHFKKEVTTKKLSVPRKRKDQLLHDKEKWNLLLKRSNYSSSTKL